MYGSSPKTPQSPTSPVTRINTTPASSEQPQHRASTTSTYTGGSNTMSNVFSTQSEWNIGNQSKGGLAESYELAIGERGRSLSVPGD